MSAASAIAGMGHQERRERAAVQQLELTHVTHTICSGSGASAGGGAGGAAGAGSAPSRSTMFHRDPNRKPTGVSRAKTWSPEVENGAKMKSVL